MKRRNFIKNAALFSAAPMPAVLESLVAEQPVFPRAPGFSLKILNTNWGFNGTRDDFFKQTAAAGYDGVEVWVPQEDADRDDLQAKAAAHGLEYGLLCGGSAPDFSRHLAQFEESLQKAIALKPLFINCHSGRDWFSFEQNRQFIDLTIKQSNSSGIPIYHETHRGRILFAAHVARQFMEKIPELQITLDISHWCNVHESLLEDQSETVALALARTEHIHTRVGHAEGPQVNDPRAPEWERTLQAHLSWWDKVVEIKAKAGRPLTMLTEFGPPNYLPALPYTRQPVADQWAINVHMKDLLRKRYQ
jgi:sugar phosphate isomerase/epimerase